MATPAPSAKPTVVTVERGDNLWNIARDYLEDGSKYTQLAKLNGLSNPNLIHTGQQIKLYGTASTSSTSTTTSSTNSNKVNITAFGLLASADSPTLYAVWLWDENKRYQTEKYEYEWEYTIEDTGGSTWWTGTKSSTEDSECTFGIPDNAERVRFRVKPISKTREVTKYKSSTSSSSKGLSFNTSKSNTASTAYTVQEPYWEAEWTNFEKDGKYQIFYTNTVPPVAPDAPDVVIDELDKTKLIASISDIDADALDATHIQFQIVKDNVSEFETSGNVAIDTTYKYVAYTNSKALLDGGEYKVRCRAIRKNFESAWSGYSSPVYTKPSKPAGFTACQARSSSTDGKVSVYLEWDAVNTATTYDIEYATNKAYFDGTDQTQSITSIQLTHHETYALEKGHTYYFRLRAINNGGESDWSDISEVTLGEAPAAPTTWSSTSTATVGGPLTLYWVHNAKDGSSQTYAQLGLEIYVANGLDEMGNINYELKWSDEEEVKNSTDFEEKDKTSHFDATAYLQENVPGYYKDGVQLRWRVRTSGVTNELGEWSVVRMIDIYAQPTVAMSVIDGTNSPVIDSGVVSSFPLHISTTTQPPTQAPIGFHVTIVSNDIYETVDEVGNNKVVNVGDQVYSKYFDQGTDLDDVKLSAGDVDLESGIRYTITCTASMNSGLTADAVLPFTVSWQDVSYTPNAAITYDPLRYITQIRPYCTTGFSTYYEITHDTSTDTYISTENVTSIIEGPLLQKSYTKDGKQVFSGFNNSGIFMYYYVGANGEWVEVSESDIYRTEQVYTTDGKPVYVGSTGLTIDNNGNVSGGEEVYYYPVQTSSPVEGVTLAVYRREFDGSYTELAKNIDHTKNTYVTDPHPSLDYARYRIVATTQSTGAVSYYDVPGFAIQEHAIIIQWAEDWTSFDAYSDDPTSQPPWSGSLLRLPYNIDVSDSYSMDVSHVNYAGRKRPVAYYGTHLGETSSWSTEIPKADKATLYALRRLAIWTGDVYVREPSGSGYWATIGVSFGQTHGELTIPVTLSITRVEGGA